MKSPECSSGVLYKYIIRFNTPITAKALNESLAKKFGYKIQLEQFTDVQLEDARNKLRTRLSQYEVNESYDSVLSSPEYQKTRMFLDVVNQEILEREMNEGKGDGNLANNAKPYDKVTKGDVIAGRLGKDEKGGKDMKKKKNESKAGYFAAVRERATEEAIPEDWIDSAIQRMSLGESDVQELKAELKLRYDLNEAAASWLLCEGEEDKAEYILATKDMVGTVTKWLEDVAAMKAEQLLELMDSIRENQGSDVASQYEQAVKPALEAIYAALESNRANLSKGLAIVSGKDVGDMMGAEPAMGGAPGEEGIGGVDLGAPEELPEPPMGAGAGAPEAERMKRESVDYSRRLGMLLSSKKK
jgi:hypothetical protein